MGDLSLETFVEKGTISNIQSEDLKKYLQASFGSHKSEPAETLFYSVDDELRLSLSRKSAQTYVERPVENIDLSTGHHSYYQKSDRYMARSDQQKSKLLAIREWERINQTPFETDIISSRRSILLLLSAVFKKAIFRLDIIAYDNLIILEAPKIEHSLDEAVMCGHNFEAFATRSEIPSKFSGKKHVSIVKHEFENKTNMKYSVSVACEVDALEDMDLDECDGRTILDKYIELKAWGLLGKRKIQSAQLQCYLAGVSKLIYGKRDENFNLEYVDKFDIYEKYDFGQPSTPDSFFHKDFVDQWFAFVCSFIIESVRKNNGSRNKRPFFFNLSCYKDKLRINPKRAHLVPMAAESLPFWFQKWRRDLHERAKGKEKTKETSVDEAADQPGPEDALVEGIHSLNVSDT